MKTSETIQKIATSLLAAQQNIAFAKKNSTNSHFKNDYANLESVIEEIKPALNAQGIVFLQTFSPSAPGFLALTTRLLHTSGEWIEDQLTMPLQKNDAHGYGSAATYSRRFALAAITGLYQADDDGNDAAQKPTKQKEVDVMELIAAMDEASTEDALKKAFATAWKASGKNETVKAHYDKCKSKFTKVEQ